MLIRKITIIYSIIILLTTLSAFGQSKQDGQLITGNLFKVYYMQYGGTPFYSIQSVMGGVILKSGTIYNNLQLQYDVYRDELIYFNKSISRMVVIDKLSVNQFWFADNQTGKKYNVVNVTDTSRAVSGYVFKLVSDSVSLYMKKQKSLDQNLSNYAVDLKLGTFYDKTHFYYDAGNGFIQVPTRRRKLAELFPEHKNELQTFMFRNGYSPKNEAHIELIFNEINRLLK